MTSFKSRRNIVVRNNGVVVKTYRDIRDRLTEESVLKKLKGAGLGVPSIISCDETSMSLEYIEGIVYAEMMEELSEEHVEALLDWQEQYYKVMDSIGRADINFRNYLYASSVCIGLDFEEISLTTPEQDYGRMLAFLASYDPAFTRNKKRAARLFLKGLARRGYPTETILPHACHEMYFMQKRRDYPPEWTQEMRSWFENL